MIYCPNSKLSKLFDRYLCFSNQIEFDLKNLNDTRSFVLKQSFGIFNLLWRKAKKLYQRGCDLKFVFNQKSKQKWPNKNHFKEIR